MTNQSAEIYISTIDRKEVYRFTNIPEEFPTLSQSAKNEQFDTFNNGEYNLLNGAGNFSFSLGCMLPCHQYSFCKGDWKNSGRIISLMKKSMVTKIPIRFIFKGVGDVDVINIIMTCEKLDWNYNHQLDFVFSADFKEYRAG
ncbi:hypothetical protein [Clostridium sp. CF012]|uniref:hypothetical protein n=1 Tax=Clostridium sp. CF012 TaxID=2843319 RepID=UPI001C0B6CF8|nr:hypothetical protein [Clostridium sp. CF012]MBU3145027.1 hypothetical protein [Clostridium sp. CF012]